MVHVPYRGQAPTTLAIFSSEVDILLTTASDTMNEHIKSGKVKLLGVSSPGLSPVAPGAPLIGKALNGFAIEAWFGILAPVSTPEPIIRKLNAAIVEAVSSPELRARYLTYGVEATGSSPEQLRSIIAEEIPQWRRVIEERKVKAE
jgi:tripartite-type tricarboxylate transporter receptor subunit TctC